VKQIYIIGLLIAGLIPKTLSAQSPNWQVDESIYEQTMTMIAALSLDNIRLSNTNDQLAAFVNGECRGKTNLIYVASEDNYFAYVTIFGNYSGEIVNFKIYNSTSNTVVDIPQTLDFEALAHVGTLFQSYSIASPTLSSNTEIISFSLTDTQTLNYTDAEEEISLEITTDLPNLSSVIPVFELSPGASLFLNNNEVISGVSSVNFDNDFLDFLVRSEDQSTLRNVKIRITQNAATTSEPRFFRRHQVCHTDGAIKVLLNVDGVAVSLKKDGSLIDISNTVNGEVLFNDLDYGNYTVEFNDTVKPITINLISN
jgi:hypothetical protein